MARKVFFAAVLSAILVASSAASFAQTHYAITNNTKTSNSASIFKLDTTDGTFSLIKTLRTDGEALLGGYFAGEAQAVSPGGACIFVSDGGSNDIAAFSSATGYSKVGNYKNPALSGASNMPLLENSAGTILYAAYEESSNLAVWTINGDCSLTLANIYTTQAFLGSMLITHDGSTLLVTYEVSDQVGSFAISGSTLTDNGTVAAIADISGIAITDDDKVVIMGTAFNPAHPSMLVTASLPGFTNQQGWTLGPGYSAGSVALSPAGAAGNGCLYIGNTGNNKKNNAGISGVMFTESPLNLTFVNNVTSRLPTYVGTIVTVNSQGNGDGVYAAETAGYAGLYSASTGCEVRLVTESPGLKGSFILSLSRWMR